jgi:hypothetical protein
VTSCGQNRPGADGRDGDDGMWPNGRLSVEWVNSCSLGGQRAGETDSICPNVSRSCKPIHLFAG